MKRDAAPAAEPSNGGHPRAVRELESLLDRIDGRGYRAYKALEGAWRYPDFVLCVDHAQGDPYAAPSRVRALLEPDFASLPHSAYHGTPRSLGTSAFLARAFADAARGASSERGTGRSGEIRMEHPGQKTLPQTAVLVGSDGSVEARFTVGLPARGRKVSGREAANMLLRDVPDLVRQTLSASSHDLEAIEAHAATNEDAGELRAILDELGLIAFVADGARLPRRSGVDDRPLAEAETIPFRSPESLLVAVDLPNAGRVTGMGIPPGVTLIVGGGFHGKSTLLGALQAGVYNHRPGDGRELVISRADAVKIRAEDGRSVAGVDISGFIDGLPFGRDTHRFASVNASGSTSQAAAIVEALESGSRLFLVDEDTSATNFMIRDRRMQLLVPKDSEPITPFVDRVRELHEHAGVSCVLVIGGSGDYLDVADLVVRMVDYQPHDVTADARRVAEERPTGRLPEPPDEPVAPPPRSLAAGALDASRGHRPTYVRVPDDRTLLFGDAKIDLVAVEQLASRAQTRAIGQGLAFLARLLRSRSATVPDALDAVDSALAEGGLDALEPRRVGDLAAFRRFELAAALNRLRGLRVE
ncbi:MAG TPA: ABC-ATPase domain-containing protein [Longimicrobiales bacterium]|nr:ABC-ATPase domain-containing protein [Longimicrobiales bacterium]